MKRLYLILVLLIPIFKALAQTSLIISDTRYDGTSPSSYNRIFQPFFKYNTAVNLPASGSNYYTLLGFRGWGDNTGGRAHELAFADNDNIYVRSGFEPTWENWRKFVTENAQGNVGIGTINPQSKLHIQSSDNTALQITKEGVIAGRIFTVTSGLAFGVDPANGATERMRITSDGNIGIGTPTPREKLSVNGKIRAYEIKVETANWPDYVFEDKYEPSSLTDLETFIKANKHLPEIPSAKAVAEDGISLGEMNAKLLKKVEEITLYLIELKKENIKLSRQIAELQQKIK